MIGVLADHDMREQRCAGTSFRDHFLGHRRDLDTDVTRGRLARQLLAKMSLDDEARRDDLEDFARFVADAHSRCTAPRTCSLLIEDRMQHVGARKVIGQRLATALAFVAG
jgi:hypothetical protein